MEQRHGGDTAGAPARARGALGAGAAPALPRSAAFPSLPRAAGRRGPAPGRELGNSPGAARSSKAFSLRFPLGLARAQGAPGSQRPTHGE